MTLIKKKYQHDLAHRIRIKMEEEEHAEWGRAACNWYLHYITYKLFWSKICQNGVPNRSIQYRAEPLPNHMPQQHKISSPTVNIFSLMFSNLVLFIMV
jgi:hypothetical protein